jgi:hypothetical protein
LTCVRGWGAPLCYVHRNRVKGAGGGREQPGCRLVRRKDASTKENASKGRRS